MFGQAAGHRRVGRDRLDRPGATPRRDPADGIWKVVLQVGPGEYQYRFIVDGVWIRDPNNIDITRNEFGQENSLLIV